MTCEKRVWGVDPGTFKSGAILWNSSVPKAEYLGDIPNEYLCDLLVSKPADLVVLELITSYGIPIGKETMQALLMIGRIQEACRINSQPCVLVTRQDVRIHLCGTAKSGDPNVRKAITDRYGCWEHGKTGKGTKANPGPLYPVTGHMMSALAVAVTAIERPDLRRLDYFRSAESESK